MTSITEDVVCTILFVGWYYVCKYIYVYMHAYNVCMHVGYVRTCIMHVFMHVCICTREKHVLFNDALNTFYLRLYGVRYMVKDHSDSEKGNPLPPHRLLLSINSKGSFICTIPQTG